MLNAMLWTSGLDVPQDGLPSTVTAEDLTANQDDKPSKQKK